MIVRLAIAFIAACSMLVLGAGSALAATSATPFEPIRVDAPDPPSGGQWGERSAAARDLDGDGVNDFFVAVPTHNVGSAVAAGRVYLVSGRTRSVIYRLDSPEPQTGANFGFYISVPGDVSGDGKDDIVVGAPGQEVYTGTGAPCGAPEPNGCNERQGRAWVFSGPSGTLHYRLDNPNPQPGRTRFGSRIGRAGDLNGDGRSELIIGAPGNDAGPAGPGCGEVSPRPAGCRVDEGQAFIFDGSTTAGPPVRSTPFRTLNMPDPSGGPAGTCSSGCGDLGSSVQGPGDVDGDGVTDQLVTATSYLQQRGRMYLFSGQSGLVLARIDIPTGQRPANFGSQDAAPLAPGDLNRDGRSELYGNGFGQDGPTGRQEGRAWIFDGRATVTQGTGVVLHELRDPTPEIGGQFGWSLDDTDYNRDGTPDLYIGQSPHHVADTQRNNQHGGTYVFDGRNGAVLKRLELPAADVNADDWQGSNSSNGPNLGWSLNVPGDLNGDGQDDYVAGAPYLDVESNIDQGRVYVFLSGPTPPTPQRPGPANPPFSAGSAAPFTGCPALTANVIRGSAASNRITGTVRADRILAGAGNDVVDALAEDDCVELGTGADRGQGGLGDDLMLGGPGRDRISSSSGDDALSGGPDRDRLEAGSGDDRVRGDSGNDSILGSFGNDRLHGVSGSDRISGSRGRDRVNGGSGRDRISGGSFGDRIAGDQGSDRINGNSGNDRIRGNSGNDRIRGSTGADRIAGDSGNDRIDARDGRRDRVSCGRGRDTVIADRRDRVARSCERVRRR